MRSMRRAGHRTVDWLSRHPDAMLLGTIILLLIVLAVGSYCRERG